MDTVDITIIGAGIIGLAVAAELSKKHKDLIVLEKNDYMGQETSSRNSEVIHAGIYYPTGSLKQKLCVEGAPLLYKICKKAAIPHKKCGKIIIAVNHSELPHLEKLYKKANSNGVKTKLLDQKEIQKLEPHTNAIAGVYSPMTGIVDSHSLMKYFYHQALKKEEEGSEVDKKDYHYQGPKPQTREAAIVMLADAVEAASRTLKNPSAKRIEEFVNEIIESKFREGQLNESSLTLRGLMKISIVFRRYLTGLFHSRKSFCEF